MRKYLGVNMVQDSDKIWSAVLPNGWLVMSNNLKDMRRGIRETRRLEESPLTQCPTCGRKNG